MADNYYTSVKNGNYFVLTKYGYEKTPDNIKSERKINKPLKGFEDRVPTSWIKKGYVTEVKVNE